MSIRPLRLFLFSNLLILLSACSGLPLIPGSAQTAVDEDILYQTSTLSALIAGEYDGDLTVAKLKQHGDFGLGTFNALDGEMIVSDGVVYQVKSDGIAYVPDDNLLTPFAVVTHFTADSETSLIDSLSCAQLQEHLDAQLLTADQPYALAIDGQFATVKTRAPQKQEKEYPPLADALAEQVEFEFQNVRGTMVGFRLPEYMQGVNSAGYHFHFITADKQAGGHVLDCETADVTVSVDDITAYYIDAS